jgi:hypothetical protein
MAQTPPLALSNIVNISVTVSPSAVTANSFNQGLFVGPSTVIPSYGTNPRLRQYPAPGTAMLSDGFTSVSPEYIAAQIYFSQTPQPQYIWIGRQDLTAIGTIAVDGRTVTDGVMSSSVAPTHLASATANFQAGDVGAAIVIIGAGAAGANLTTTIASVTSTTAAVLAGSCLTTVTAAQTSIGFTGSGYHANDVVSITQAGGTYGFATILTVGAAGQVLTIGVNPGTQGTGYTTATALPTVAISPSIGTGLEVNITAGESLLQATQACRAASNTWYGLSVNNPSDTDNLLISEWADPLWQTTRYYPWSASSGIPNGTAGNVALQLQTLELRVLGTYATTQSGLYPNNIYAAAGLMGVEMGLNTGLANSFFTVAHKPIVGIAPEPLTQTQYTNIINAGFSAYGDFGGQSNMLEPGFMSNGSPSYLWINLAMLVQSLQINTMAVLRNNPAVAQTNSGQQLLIHAANDACDTAVNIGFLAGATWNGVTFNIAGVSLTDGEALPSGYKNQSQPYSAQSANDRAAGKAMPIYSAITTAGAVQSLLIGVYTQL